MDESHFSCKDLYDCSSVIGRLKRVVVAFQVFLLIKAIIEQVILCIVLRCIRVYWWVLLLRNVLYLLYWYLLGHVELVRLVDWRPDHVRTMLFSLLFHVLGLKVVDDWEVIGLQGLVTLLWFEVGWVYNTEGLRGLEGVLWTPSQDRFVVVCDGLVSQEYSVFLRGDKSEFAEAKVIDLVGNLVLGHYHWRSL